MANNQRKRATEKGDAAKAKKLVLKITGKWGVISRIIIQLL
jgi:hypothetical protein